MLKTNSKKARENVRSYIMENENLFEYKGYGYFEKEPETFEEIAKALLKIFRREKGGTKHLYPNEYRLFEDWCQGLCSALDTCYYYNRSAVDDLGKILEETEDEKNRYSDEKASELLMYTIQPMTERKKLNLMSRTLALSQNGKNGSSSMATKKSTVILMNG